MPLLSWYSCGTWKTVSSLRFYRYSISFSPQLSTSLSCKPGVILRKPSFSRPRRRKELFQTVPGVVLVHLSVSGKKKPTKGYKTQSLTGDYRGEIPNAHSRVIWELSGVYGCSNLTRLRSHILNFPLPFWTSPRMSSVGTSRPLPSSGMLSLSMLAKGFSLPSTPRF